MKKIPDTAAWQPRQDAANTLKEIFYKRCLHIESLIINKSQQEKDLNVDNFDSGPGVEDIIRDELSKLLPGRYSIKKGTLNDRNGFTSGDQDIIIFNDFWFPNLKAGATIESRKFHFPIEGAYAVGEVKQTLTIESLDNAIEKLVRASRLERPTTGRNRVIENKQLEGCEHGFTNPLYTFIIAVSLEPGLVIDDVFLRFFEINKQLKRNEIINCVCILKEATINWMYFDNYSKEFRPAFFSNPDEDLNSPIVPVLVPVDQVRKSVFYDFITNLTTHLYNTILGAEDLAVAYGNNYHNIKVPPLEKFSINPK
jgi:hypothetical protein